MRPAASLLLTLTFGAAGGTLFDLIGLPAGWLSGAMIVVALAALSRLPVELPGVMRNGLFVVLGLSMGAGVSPEVMSRISQWPVSMAILFLVVILVTLATYAFLRLSAGWDKTSAYFGALPGALSFVMALAAETRSDLARIAASQSIRLLILVVVLPYGVTGSTDHVMHGMERPVVPGAGQLALLASLCLAASLIAVRLRFPGGWLTGAFFMSSALNASGTIPVALPEWVLVPCYIGLGCFIGCRFSQTTWRSFLSMIGVGLGAVAVGLTVSAGAAWGVAHFLGLPFGQLLLAYAPGGLEVMTLLAFMLDLDPAFVAAHQLARYIGMVLLLPLVTALVLREK
nr:AbrB family transcriptional regulator [Roseibium litorale]